MKKGEKLLLVLGALLIAAGVFVGVTLGWDYSPDNYAYNDIAFTSADTETGECSFVSVQLSELEVNIYSTTDKTVSIAARGAKTPDRVSVVLDGGVLRITEKKLGLFQRLAVSDDDAVILRIPEKWVGTVDAATQSGDVYVSGLVSPQLTLRASSASGAVSASELKVAETQLVTTSGNIFVSTTRGGTITAGTTSGYMNISDVKAESASLSSVSGSISVRNAELTGVLTLHTTSGDIDLDDISAAGIETGAGRGRYAEPYVHLHERRHLRRAAARGRIRRHGHHRERRHLRHPQRQRRYTDIQDRNRQRRHRPRRLNKAMQNFPAERPHGRAGPAERKKRRPRRHMPDGESRQGKAAGYAGGLGVTKRCSPLSKRKAGNLFISHIIAAF